MEWMKWAIEAIVGILDKLLGGEKERRDRQIEKDRATYNELVEVLPESTIVFLKNDLTDGFRYEHFSPIERYRDKCEYPQFYFLDKELEGLRIELLNSINEFVEQIGLRFDGRSAGDTVIMQFSRHGGIYDREAANVINQLAGQIVDIYEKLEKTAHRKI